MPEPSAPGAAVVLLSKSEAKKLTGKIKRNVGQLWALLAEAHDRQAWRAMGYKTWAEYVGAEFAMGRAHAYRLLDQAKVIAELSEAAGVSPFGDISEGRARAVKPVMPRVKKAVAKKVAALPPNAPPAAREAIVSEAVAKASAPPRPVPTAPPRRSPLTERMADLGAALATVVGIDPAKAAAAVPAGDRAAVKRAAVWLGRVAKALDSGTPQTAGRRSGRDDVTPNFKK